MARTGRPTKLTQEVRQRAAYYFEDFIQQHDSVIPTVAGLALYLGVNKDTIIEWSKEDEDFSVSYERMMQLQEVLTVNKALTGDFNSNTAKLILSNHGYSDRQAVDVTSTDGTMSPSRLDVSKLSESALREILNASPESHER